MENVVETIMLSNKQEAHEKIVGKEIMQVYIYQNKKQKTLFLSSKPAILHQTGYK